MSILYKPVLIESAEQAEALPRGTQRLQDGREGLAVGWTALVPIEAEEETSKTYPNEKPYYTHTRVFGGGRATWRYIVRDDEGNQLADVTDEVNAWEATGKPRTRYVTPWEAA